MDAGLAAVLGALAGAVATTGAAFATGWSAREQAKIAARAEHRRQRRDARQAVYEEFIDAARTHAAHATHLSIGPMPQNEEEFRQLVREGGNQETDSLIMESYTLHGKIEKILTRVQLAGGPADIGAAAKSVCNSSFAVMGSMAALPSERRFPGREALAEVLREIHERQMRLDEVIDRFVEAASVALDDDGTRP
ncbi:hypothetical protein [Streptomyces massasporeus]|uniref:hypothetical protein n=1 Tax=Streptomyces massasporeus TaxID=67324 RepID=UPI001672763C|nr:hypothetical protein [Streptomyces massasporeus]